VGILRGTAKPSGGKSHGQCIALRADMDGLPIQVYHLPLDRITISYFTSSYSSYLSIHWLI
jgi:hypothetical protein